MCSTVKTLVRRLPYSDIVNKLKTDILSGKQDRILPDPEYCLENGLRKVKPWYKLVNIRVRGKHFINKSWRVVFKHNVVSTNSEYMEKAWKDGRLFVDGVPICSLDDKAQNGARVVSIVHIHEQPVLDAKIKIIHNDSEMLVVDKPCSIPVCPSGRFHFNSLPLILKHEHGFTDLHLMHRIDRMTSGIQMFSKHLITSIPYWSHEWRKLVEKEYIARVVGEFPAEVTCDAKILSIDRIIGIHTTSDHRFAKDSRTDFKRISTDGRTSIVSCKPRTGRTHQIRVHLKHLGYPIINDPIYNNPIWDDVSHPSPFKRGRDLCKKFADVQHQNSSLHLHSSDVYDPFCQQCSRQLIDPTPEELRMDLHAWKYSSPNWSFESELPYWAKE